MKHTLRFASIVVATLLAFAFTSCDNASSTEYVGYGSSGQLVAPTNLVINSITKETSFGTSYKVNFSFTYNGEVGNAANYVVLGCSTTNDNSQANYGNHDQITLEKGNNTRTCLDAKILPTNGETIYFWVKACSYDLTYQDSPWSNVATFTYTE